MLTPGKIWRGKFFLPFSEILINFRKSHKISANLHKSIKSYSKLKSPWANLTSLPTPTPTPPAPPTWNRVNPKQLYTSHLITDRLVINLLLIEFSINYRDFYPLMSSVYKWYIQLNPPSFYP